MLKIHQRMGLITTLLIATVDRLHGRWRQKLQHDFARPARGSRRLTGDLYGITAYYAIRAPRVPGTETPRPIRFHKVMAWIHAPE